MADVTTQATIEVVYALPEHADSVTLAFAPGMTAAAAVELSGVLSRHPEAADEPLVLGVFGMRIERDHILRPGDRVELCRPLREDPRAVRKRRQQDGRVIGSVRPAKRTTDA
jgi:putative ubiquitin-RnfH superfamily antitoxin RatB of RatAB toxin-antitoxin module